MDEPLKGRGFVVGHPMSCAAPGRKGAFLQKRLCSCLSLPVAKGKLLGTVNERLDHAASSDEWHWGIGVTLAASAVRRSYICSSKMAWSKARGLLCRKLGT